jgi:hypothetical protein
MVATTAAAAAAAAATTTGKACAAGSLLLVVCEAKHLVASPLGTSVLATTDQSMGSSVVFPVARILSSRPLGVSCAAKTNSKGLPPDNSNDGYIYRK